MYELAKLDNGLRVLTVRMPQTRSLSIGVWIKAGGRYELAKNAGISHFLEHLLFEGTKKRSSKKIKQAIEGVGGSLNGFTSEEVTCYLVKILDRYLRLSIDVLVDMVLNPLIASESVEKERSIITEEIRMYMDLPGHYVGDLLSRLLWPEQPLGMSLAGTVDTVASISREDLVDFKARFYTSLNSVVVVAGTAEHQEIVEICKGYFEDLPKGQPPKFAPAFIKQKKPQSDFQSKQTEQTHIALGVHGVSNSHPDRYAVSLIHIILGANMSSRLFQEIREKRALAYEISTSVKKYKDTGAFVISGGIKNTKTYQAIEVILNELEKMKQGLVPEKELKRAKEFYAGQMLLALEDTSDHMLWAGEQLTSLDKVETSQEILNNMRRVTSQDIKEIAQRLFNATNLNLATIGPVEDKEKHKIENILKNL